MALRWLLDVKLNFFSESCRVPEAERAAGQQAAAPSLCACTLGRARPGRLGPPGSHFLFLTFILSIGVVPGAVLLAAGRHLLSPAEGCSRVGAW